MLPWCIISQDLALHDFLVHIRTGNAIKDQSQLIDDRYCKNYPDSKKCVFSPCMLSFTFNTIYSDYLIQIYESKKVSICNNFECSRQTKAVASRSEHTSMHASIRFSTCTCQVTTCDYFPTSSSSDRCLFKKRNKQNPRPRQDLNPIPRTDLEQRHLFHGFFSLSH